jgi:hypothetical protein
MENPFLEKHILTSVEIVRSYLFDKPFHLYLKEVFRNHKNWGSKDRRNYKKYCYLILKNAGSFHTYLESEVPNFKSIWVKHYSDLPFYFWPICIFHPNCISKLNLTELNHSVYKEQEPLILYLERIQNSKFDLTFVNNYIVNWILALVNGHYTWNAYDALNFSVENAFIESIVLTQNTINKNTDFHIPNNVHIYSGKLDKSHLKYESHQNLSTNKSIYIGSLSNGLELSQLNTWFQKEAPVFYLDKTEGLNQEFPPNSDVNKWVENGQGIIQDKSSTLSIKFLLDYLKNPVSADLKFFTYDSNNTELLDSNFKIWDCCSGAGGKSLSFQIQFNHVFKTIHSHLTDNLFKSNWICTDIRQNILDNLKKRFELLGLKHPKTSQMDLLDESIGTDEANVLQSNLIIADLPCSGSGTWRRTPEELIKTVYVGDFAIRQIRIIENILKIKSTVNSKSTYYIYYMTCSVFAQENELNVEILLKNHPHIECLWQRFFGGYSENADFIYGAFLKINPN